MPRGPFNSPVLLANIPSISLDILSLDPDIQPIFDIWRTVVDEKGAEIVNECIAKSLTYPSQIENYVKEWINIHHPLLKFTYKEESSEASKQVLYRMSEVCSDSSIILLTIQTDNTCETLRAELNLTP